MHHLFFLIETKILFDPYLSGPAFNNGWHLICEEDHELYLKNITHIFFSRAPRSLPTKFFKRFSDKEKSKILSFIKNL